MQADASPGDHDGAVQLEQEIWFPVEYVPAAQLIGLALGDGHLFLDGQREHTVAFAADHCGAIQGTGGSLILNILFLFLFFSRNNYRMR